MEPEVKNVIVIDIGKTLAKVSLWSGDGKMLDRQTKANVSPVVEGIPRLDEIGIREWLPDALSRYAGEDLGAIVPVAHGAGVAAIEDGVLAYAPYDYEASVPAGLDEEYQTLRDPFGMTGSPLLPGMLNLGKQLFVAQRLGHFDPRAHQLVPWANYWSWFLAGRACSEVTSLGCHTDLWCPHEGTFSPMARAAGWADRFAPIRKASDAVGFLRAELAQATGLSPQVPVLAGLHDSNAALLAAAGFDEITEMDATVLSTGTWFVAMRLAKEPVATAALAGGRDCLMNVDAFGNPVPSARFMGGREIETIIEIDTRQVDIKPDQPALVARVPKVLANGAMLLPTQTPGCGPFPDLEARWINRPSDWIGLRTAACLYAALVADEALGLIGSKDHLLIEGRFAEAEVFVRALASLRPQTKVFIANAHNDVALGALRLLDSTLKPAGRLQQVMPLDGDLAGYREAWRTAMKAAA